MCEFDCLRNAESKLGASKRGHSLLEAVIATSIFIVISVALSGVWVLYAQALGKSGEHMAANFLSRSVTEGLIANGWDYLQTQDGLSPLSSRAFVVRREVRGRSANINFEATWKVELNTDDGTGNRVINDLLTENLARITVSVRWTGPVGGKVIPGTDFNNEVVYVSMVYKEAIE